MVAERYSRRCVVASRLPIIGRFAQPSTGHPATMTARHGADGETSPRELRPLAATVRILCGKRCLTRATRAAGLHWETRTLHAYFDHTLISVIKRAESGLSGQVVQRSRQTGPGTTSAALSRSVLVP